MPPAPITLFAYNRPWHTRQTVEALRKNDLASASDLIIFSDGPKNDEVCAKVEEVRKYLKTLTGFKRVIIHEGKENQGLANSIIDGVTRTVNEYGRVIVVEDDLVTSPFFLKYMNDGLDFYEQDPRVISILGYVYSVKVPLPETFFIRGASCWGWGTWKRGWDLFEKDGSVLLKRLQERRLTRAFDCNGTYPYTEMLKAQVAGKNQSWAVRWNASAFLNDKLTLFPGRSLVCNIGNDGSGTHTGVNKVLDVSIAQGPVVVRKIEVAEHCDARKAFEDCFRSWQGSLVGRMKSRIKSVLRQLLGKRGSIK